MKLSEASKGTMDWKKFEQFWHKFSFVDKNSGKLTDNWVENYVQRILKNVPGVSNTNQALSHEIFQTHHFVFIKIKVPDSIRERDMQVSVSSNQLKIEGLPENQSFVVQLPVLVKARECRASYKDGVLQIKVRKNDDDLDFYNVGIRYE